MRLFWAVFKHCAAMVCKAWRNSRRNTKVKIIMSFPNRPNLYQSSFYFPIEEVIDIGFSRRVLQKCPGHHRAILHWRTLQVSTGPKVKSRQIQQNFLSIYVIFHEFFQKMHTGKVTQFLSKNSILLKTCELWYLNFYAKNVQIKGAKSMKYLNFRAKNLGIQYFGF